MLDSVILKPAYGLCDASRQTGSKTPRILETEACKGLLLHTFAQKRGDVTSHSKLKGHLRNLAFRMITPAALVGTLIKWPCIYCASVRPSWHLLDPSVKSQFQSKGKR